jgi:hypothetical protein
MESTLNLDARVKVKHARTILLRRERDVPFRPGNTPVG